MLHHRIAATRHPHAFSLVELSIVLVILGLLVGGILAGQSLIRASELRSVITQHQKFHSATMAFIDKYFYLPGDLPNATQIWGKDSTSTASCSGQTGTAATPGTCNGDGNGIVNQSGEDFRAWQHLSNAGLIEGNMRGYMDAPNTIWAVAPVLGRDIPAGKITNSGWMFYYDSRAYSVSPRLGFTDLPDIRNNYFFFGGAIPTAIPVDGILKTDEAWNIDLKLDDGRPATGMVRTGANATTCVNGLTSNSTYNFGTNYLCPLGFVLR